MHILLAGGSLLFLRIADRVVVLCIGILVLGCGLRVWCVSVAVLWMLVLIVLLCVMRFTFVSCWLVISFVYIGC